MIGALARVANRLGQVVVKNQMSVCHIGQVRHNIVWSYVNKTILHVFRVYELDIINQIKLLQ